MSQNVPAFDVLGPLPEGVAVLEASAGTGKTFTIAALAARYVAAGIPLSSILIVTFTRMATGELRERVRERIVSAERILADVASGAEVPAGEEVAVLLAQGTAEEVALRRRLLARAVADFDDATITTTHGFCLEALSSLGFTGDVAPDCQFVEDVRDLIDEVVDDLFVRRFWKDDVRLDLDEARAIVGEAISNPSAYLEPEDADEGSLAAMRYRLAKAAREELERRKRRASVMTYDDLLTRLDNTLAGEAGDAAAARLRARYRVVLVDEFQDTDPVQWSIMRRAFAHDEGTLVLIGDPKQAIYAFRGADVYAYLQAAGSAGTRATLTENWRSDQGLIDAYDEVFGPVQLGHPGIVYRQVRATGANRAPRLEDAPHNTPLRVRIVDRTSLTAGMTKKGFAKEAVARDHVARDVADDIAALLNSTARLVTSRVGSLEDRRPVRPGDIAVLVRTNWEASLVRDMLEAANVPAVINGAGSVFASPAAHDWLRLLEAIERPTSAARVRVASLSVFIGWTAVEVAGADDGKWEGLHTRLHQYGHVLRTGGVASLMEALILGEGLPQRVLVVEDGERQMTDLQHVAQLLHQTATKDQLGVTALTTWLRQRIAEAGGEDDEERSRRLESDAAAVQVLTIHRSKGLEFPIVYYPFLWTKPRDPKDSEPAFFHDAGHADRRTLDVGLDGPEFPKHFAQYCDESRGEDLRLAYVALTRAKHQAIVWWAGSWMGQHSALSRLVFSRLGTGEIPAEGGDVPTDAEALARFTEMAEAAPGCIAVEGAQLGLPQSWEGPLPELSVLAAATFDRDVDQMWRRTSYSDITTFSHDPRVASEPEHDGIDDESGDLSSTSSGAPGESEGVELQLRSTPALLAEMPGGVYIGTLVHNVLEAVDFAAPDLADEIGSRLAQKQSRHSIDVGDVDEAAAGLCAAVETPLGPLAGDISLRDIKRADRIDEMTFELPLVGGDAPTAVLTPAGIADVLRTHLPAGEPLRAYADRLSDPELRSTLRGYLTGSIDLVFRITEDGRTKYGIVDYKTNRLGDFASPLTAWDYRPAALQAEMFRAHYALQGLLYSTALHRYLRWRIPDHDAERDLAGVYYLFLRGMTGSGTPRVDGVPCGVFGWKPPGELVNALSDLLDEGASR